jgi:anti-sigma factor RsiW
VITCAELDQFIVDYLDGMLSLWQGLKFRVHLFGCRKCRAYLDGYKKTIALGKKAFADPDKPAAEEAPEELIRVILAARRK